MLHPPKRLLLLFPPLSMPTSPPLGLALLAGWLRRELPGCEVLTLDLNLWLVRRLVDGVSSGLIAPTQEITSAVGADAAMLGRVAAAFRGENNAAFYSNHALYDRYGDIFLRFIEVWGDVLEKECAAWERDGETSPLLAELAAEIDALEPDWIGFSLIFNRQLPFAAMLGRDQRQRKGRRVIFGGACFSGAAAGNFFDAYPEAADFVITGDGELPLKALLQGAPPEQTAGVSCRRDGRIVSTPPIYPRAVADYGPPDFSSLDPAAYYSPEPVLPLLLARGCYWRRCAFCVHHRSAGLTYRPTPVGMVIDVMKDLAAQGMTKFSFVDEMIPPALFRQLAEGILAAGLEIDYYALTRPEAGFNRELLQLMAASGCRYLLWGVESASQRILNLMDKGTRVEVMVRVLNAAREAGIANHVFVICGFPTESELEWQATLRFLDDRRQVIQGVHRGVFALEPGSPVHEAPGKFAVTNIREVKRTPLGPRLAFDCNAGMTRTQVAEAFKAALPRLREFNPYARCLANYRDHALLVYAEKNCNKSTWAWRTPREEAKASGQIAIGAVAERVDGGQKLTACLS